MGVDRPSVDVLPVGLAQLDDDERFVWLNASAASVIGKPAASVLGQRFSEVFAFTPEDLFPQENSYPRMMLLTEDPGRAAMIYRTRLGDGELLTVADATERYQELLRLRASHWLADRTRTRLQLIIDASISFASATTEQRLAEVLAETAASAYRAEYCAVLMLDSGNSITLAAGTNPLSQLLKDPRVVGWVRSRREVVLVSGVERATELMPQLGQVMERTGVHSLLVAPVSHENAAYGVFACFFMHPRTFDEEAAPLATALAGQAGQALATLRLQGLLAHAATHDETTGLPNRRFLEIQVGQAIGSRSRQLAVLFIDLDRFKTVNDTYGHLAGDAVLREVAARLKAGLREGDIIARYGGDEFLIICEVDGPQSAMDIAERLRRSVQRPLEGIAPKVTVGASVGVALTHSAAIADIDEFIRAADQAMYRAKASGGDLVVTA